MGPVLSTDQKMDLGCHLPNGQRPVYGVENAIRGPFKTGGRLPPEGHCRTPNFNLNNSNKLK